MPVLLGTLASVCIGVSDYFGRYCARRTNAMTTVGTALIGGIGITAILLVVVPSSISLSAMLWGAVSGVAISIALTSFWHAMAISSPALASPIVAAVGALGPLAYGLATGERPSLVVAFGIGLAVVGLVAAIVAGDFKGNIRLGVAFAILAGCAFAAAAVCVALTSLSSGMWPAVSQRIAATLVIATTVRVAKVPQFLPRSLRLAGFVAGVVGGSGVAALVAGLQRGPVGAVAVAGSLYPVVTIALSVFFDGERLRWWQTAGIAATLLGISLMVLG